MLDVSEADLWSSVTYLIEKGWVESQQMDGNNQNDTRRFRCPIQKIQQDLAELGYVLPHFALLGPRMDPTCLSVDPADKGDGKPSSHHSLTYLMNRFKPDSSGFF